MNIFSLHNPFLGIFVPLFAYLFLRFFPNLDPVIGTPLFHFQLVSTISLIAFLISIGIGVVGLRKRNLQVIYESIAFISLAGLFSVHGLATPGFILGPTRLVGIAAQLSVLTMAFWLLLATLPSQHWFSAWLSNRARYLLWIWTPLILIAGIAAFINPALVNWIPVDQAPLTFFVAGLTIVMAAISAFRNLQSYRYARFPFQLAMLYTGGWIAVAQVIITTGETFYLSWWIYHFLLLLAMLVTLVGLVAQYSVPNSLAMSVRGLFSNDPRERLQAAISPGVKALVAATEARDTYTAGHSYRVAYGAVGLGVALKLPAEDLRVLAQGAIIHDVGKLQVPDRILNKAGPLTEEERTEINKHPVAGYELCARLGFMAGELELIRSHHERLDGTGYPDQLGEKDISRLVRILSIVDVYDALTSKRAYRPSWEQADAFDYLRSNSGTQFDGELVEAWIDLLNSEAKLKPGTGELKF